MKIKLQGQTTSTDFRGKRKKTPTVKRAIKTQTKANTAKISEKQKENEI